MLLSVALKDESWYKCFLDNYDIYKKERSLLNFPIWEKKVEGIISCILKSTLFVAGVEGVVVLCSIVCVVFRG